MKKIFPLLTINLLLFLSGEVRGQSFKDFDVAASAFDANGFPLNPKWGKQAEQHILPNPAESCPIQSDSDDPNDWTASPQYPNCTTFPVSFNGGIWCGPHVNFMPVTYEGTVRWGDHTSALLDDDYTLNVTRDDAALFSTAGSQVHIEFNSDETVDNWDDTHTWWDDFHHNWVDQGTAHARIDGSFVSVIGLLNLDALHGGKTELHPVYSMFVQLKSGRPIDVFATSSSWAFFVRNWGDQGFCGSDDQGLFTSEQKIKIFIPNALGLISDNIWAGAQKDDQLSPMSVSAQPHDNGVLLTFTLLPPEKQSWFVGDITFSTRRPTNTLDGVALAATATGRNANVSNDIDDVPGPDLKALIERIDRLPEGSKKELYEQLQSLNKKAKPFPVKATFTRPVTVVGNQSLVRVSNVATAKVNREKRIEFVKKYLAEKKVE
jgi:hypothetical protein